jgi:hypothetical protein
LLPSWRSLRWLSSVLIWSVWRYIWRRCSASFAACSADFRRAMWSRYMACWCSRIMSVCVCMSARLYVCMYMLSLWHVWQLHVLYTGKRAWLLEKKS